MTEQLKMCFLRLETETNKLQKINYLKHMIDNEEVTEFEDIGLCRWNISDNFALLRDGRSLLCNHKDFYEFVTSGDTCYLYWLVCDATQRLTLEKDGYSDYWWSLYYEAITQNSKENYPFAEFCVHRAALYVNPFLPHIKNNLKFAIENYENLLSKTKDKPEYLFYKVVYYSLVSRFSTFNKVELASLCEELFDGLSCCEEKNNFLTGEWKSFLVPFDRYKQSVIGINSAINAFIYSNNLLIAKELYDKACTLGMEKNDYIESKLRW